MKFQVSWKSFKETKLSVSDENTFRRIKRTDLMSLETLFSAENDNCWRKFANGNELFVLQILESKKVSKSNFKIWLFKIEIQATLQFCGGFSLTVYNVKQFPFNLLHNARNFLLRKAFLRVFQGKKAEEEEDKANVEEQRAAKKCSRIKLYHLQRMKNGRRERRREWERKKKQQICEIGKIGLQKQDYSKKIFANFCRRSLNILSIQ